MRDVLRCATTTNGAQSVIMDGILLMLMLLVASLDFQDLVSYPSTTWPQSIPTFHVDANATTSAVFGPGMGPVLLENVICTGNEDRLFDCTNSGLGVSSCSHSRDAGVRCSTQCKLLTSG